jgi:hypothetical protein
MRRSARHGVSHRVLIGRLAACACLLLGAALASADSLGSGKDPQGATPAPAGMTIHVDPQTGAILDAPAPGSVPMQLSPALQNALSTSHQGLQEVPSPVMGGGVMIDLQGRFLSPLIGTIDADGNLRIQHLHRPATSGDAR